MATKKEIQKAILDTIRKYGFLRTDHKRQIVERMKKDYPDIRGVTWQKVAGVMGQIPAHELRAWHQEATNKVEASSRFKTVVEETKDEIITTYVPKLPAVSAGTGTGGEYTDKDYARDSVTQCGEPKDAVLPACKLDVYQLLTLTRLPLRLDSTIVLYTKDVGDDQETVCAAEYTLGKTVHKVRL